MKKLSFISFLIGLTACSTVRHTFRGHVSVPGSIKEMHLLATVEIPHNDTFEQTVIGGLSGISYNEKEQVFYAISDDRSKHNPARFYTFKLSNIASAPKITFEKVTYLLSNSGKKFPSVQDYEEAKAKGKAIKYTVPDPEDIVYNAKKGNFTWVNEGERYGNDSFTILQNPSVNMMQPDGRIIASYPLPKLLKMTPKSGPDKNRSLESVTITPSGQKLFTCTEEPLIEDVPLKGKPDTGFVRIFQYRNESRSLEYSYAYPLHLPGDVSVNNKNVFGISGLLAMNDSTLLVLERVYIPQVGNKIRLYQVECGIRNRLPNKGSLLTNREFIPLNKQLVLDFAELGAYVDNVEGLCWGPKVKGKQTIVFISDNNFSHEQKTLLYIVSVE